MSHATKPPAKIGTQGTAGMLSTARTHSTAGKPVTAGPPATACLKETQKRQQHQWLHQECQQ
jgi:hypothetical protein